MIHGPLSFSTFQPFCRCFDEVPIQLENALGEQLLGTTCWVFRGANYSSSACSAHAKVLSALISPGRTSYVYSGVCARLLILRFGRVLAIAHSDFKLRFPQSCP